MIKQRQQEHMMEKGGEGEGLIPPNTNPLNFLSSLYSLSPLCLFI